LRELEWLTPVRLQELEDEMLEISPGVKLEVSGALQFRNS
ncbi:asparaginase, partial [bacterium]|nr:asparaginase [bacterium]